MCSRVCGIGPSAADTTDRTVHLGSARDHVLHVVGVTGTVDVRVVALVGLVLDVGGRPIVMPRAFSSGALSISSKERSLASVRIGEHLGDGRRQVVLPWSM